VWDETAQAWFNGTFYLKRTATSMFWIYHKDTLPGASTGTYMWSNFDATGDETPATVTFVTNQAFTQPQYAGLAPVPVFEEVVDTPTWEQLGTTVAWMRTVHMLVIRRFM
jgi:hypothetical protein